MSNKFYITTSIVYANSKPHVGFALETFQADAIARLQRLLGKDVFFLTGTDENGSKIYAKAISNNQTPQEYVDEVSAAVRKLADDHQVSYSDFIRTTDQQKHWPTVVKMWEKLQAKGLLEKRKFSGLYCSGCEAYKKENELNEKGECPDHLKKPEIVSEENYFFKLSEFSEIILQKINSGELKILSKERENQIVSLLKEGLLDVSFSRSKETMPWGVPVPGDDGQVMYVWCDALTNYLSGLDYFNPDSPRRDYWPANIHLIGHDILRFHAAIWPAMLIAADIPLPKIIYTHGHILSGGQKMSKSLGNVIDPQELSEKFGPEALRIILLKEISAFSDSDLTIERFQEIYNSDLANKLGNLVSRTVAMAQKYFGGKITAFTELKQDISIKLPDIKEYDYGQTKFGRTDLLLSEVWQMIEVANKYVDEQKPWELAKNAEQEKLQLVLLNLLETIRLIALYLEIVAPTISKKILAALAQDQFDSSQNNQSNDYIASLEWGKLKADIDLQSIPPLFPKALE